MRLQSSYFEIVAGTSSMSKDIVIPAGETWEIEFFVGSAAYTPDAEVRIEWAGNLLASTHGDAAIEIAQQITGDGSATVSIVLDNAGPSARALGGQWTGRKL